MVVPLLFVIVLILFLIITISWNKYLCKSKNHPPGPRGLPLIGNLLQFDDSRPHIYLWRLYKEYGPLVYLKHGVTRILVVNTAKMAKEILKTQDLSFCSRPPVVAQQELSYGGLDMAFSPYNRQWREMRKISVLHLLSPKRVLTFRPVREDEVRRMVEKISSALLSSSPVDLSRMAMSLASNLICRVAFGRRYDDDEYEKIRFDRLVMEAQALMVSFYFTNHFPMLGWVDKVSGLLGKVRKTCEDLDAFYHTIMEDHLKQDQRQEDIIDLMIQLKQADPSSQITWDHIKALLMDLFVAGTDTVAAAIVWAMTALIQRPEIMKRVQAEIREVLGKKGKVDEEDLGKLPYMKAVVLESLRLYPPARVIFRTQILEKKCSVAGYEVEPGTSVFINGWAISRDPETWENPDEFLPERFMGAGNNGLSDYVNFEMIPFGGGRRRCPGMGLGLISTELAVANLVYGFDWALPPGVSEVDTDALPGLTMHKKNALLLVPTKANMLAD